MARQVQNVTQQRDPECFALMQARTAAWLAYYDALNTFQQHPIRANQRAFARAERTTHTAQGALEAYATRHGYEMGSYGRETENAVE